MRRSVGLLAALLSGCALLSSQQEDLAEIYTQKGALYLQEGKLHIALKDLKEALRHDPDHAEAHGLLGILYEQVGMWDKAKEHYRRAVELDPENLRWRDNYGRFLCFHGKPEAGLEQIKQAADFPLYENRPIALTNAALCAMKLGQEALAESYLQQALTLAPDFLPALEAKILLAIHRGEVVSAQQLIEHYRSLGGAEEAVRKLEEALYQKVRERSDGRKR